MDPSVFNFSDPGCFLFPAHNTEYSSQMCEHSFQRLVKHILREYQWKQPNNMTHDFDEGQDLGQDKTLVRFLYNSYSGEKSKLLACPEEQILVMGITWAY